MTAQNEQDKKRQEQLETLSGLMGKANYSRSTGEAVNDLWQSAKSGLVAVPQAGVGVLSMMSGGHAGKAFSDNIWDMKKTQENIGAKKSATAKAQQAQFERAEGFGGKLGAIWDNPMMAVDATVQSLPSMFAGGLVGRGVGKFAGIQNGAVRAGIGEGVIGAGSAAENMRSENEDGLLTGKQIAGSMAIGGATGLLGYGGGKLAQKLGIADADTLLAGGARNATTQTAQNTAKGLSGWKGSVAGVGKGALAEGVLEELPQTIAETALDNWANDRALSENMAGNAAMGLASGSLMGGTIGGISGWRGKGNNDNNQNPPPNSIIPEEYVPTSPNGGGSTAVDVDEHGNIIAKPTNATNGETALTPMQERWADQSRMIDDSTERQGFQGGLLENKGTPILDRNIALDNGTILRAGDPNAYNEWLAYEREQAAAKRDENIRQGVNDITPVPTEAVAYGLASNLNNHQGVSTPLLEFSQSVVDRMTQNGVDVHALAGSQDKQAQLTDILRNTDPRTFTNPQSFDNWVAQNEYINQFKAGNQNHGLVQPQKPSEQLGLNPNQGSLTRSAVVAVDSGASPVGQASNTQGKQELSAYQAQRAKQQQTQAQNEQIAKEVFANAPKLVGKQNYIQVGNERLPTQLMVVEAEALTPTTDNTTNQARDRNRTASRLQVNSIASNLDPAQLADSTTMAHGSPTISADGTIIAGNGRTMALKQAYAQGKGEEYRQMLLDKADEYGLDKTTLSGMKNPVLVKNVGNIGQDRLRQLALNSNEAGTMAQSAFENARADVERVANLNLNGLQINESTGDINTPANRAIINEFISQFPIEQQNALRTADGMLSKQGLERFENALLLSAYGDNPTTQSILESTDIELRNAVKAIIATAPTIAKTKQNIKEGITPDDDIASDISEALSVLAKLRREGIKPSDYLAQQNLFGDVLSDTGKRLLGFMDKNIKSVVKIRSLLYKYYANLSQDNLKQDDMFGKPTQTKQSRLNQALQELGHDEFIQSSTNRNKPNTQSDNRASANQSATSKPQLQARPTSQTGAVNERPEKSGSDEQGVGRADEELKQAVQEKNVPQNNDNDSFLPYQVGDLLVDKKSGSLHVVFKVNDDDVITYLFGSRFGHKLTTAYSHQFAKTRFDVAPKQTNNSEQNNKPPKETAQSDVLQNIKKHRDFVDKYQATHNDKAMQKQLLADIVSDVYRDNVRTNDLNKYKHFIQNKDDVVEQIFNQLQEQQNANQSRTQNPSNRLLADTPSTGVGANGNGRETTSVHSKSDKSSERRDTNQSNNRNDSERSSGVQPDGAKTGLSSGVNADFASYVKNHETLAKATKAYFDDHLKGKAFDTVIGKVHILGSSWQKKLKFGINSDPLQAYSIPHIPEILTHGNYEGRNELTKDRKDDFVAFHSFVKEINANGVPVFARLLVGEKSNKQFEFVVYSIYPNKELLQKETPNSSGLSEVTKALLGDGNSLAKSDNDVNTKQTTAQALDNALSTTNQADFTLSDDMVQTGSVKDKLATNIAIIELLQTLKQENRQPTNDEKALMAKYTGFGGLSNAFPDSQGNYKKGFDTLGTRLRNLMSRDEYENARASSTSAFFTPPNVINAMWDIAQRLGHNGGVVLEPSAGVGAFIGHAPKNLPQKIIGTEIDPTTAAITNYLYPHASIFNQGYETLSVPDNSVDLAIGNPPYGGVRLNFKDKPHLSGKTIANSFMQGTLEQVKPNGLSVMVVSSSFMDSTDASTRKAMAELGELVGAVRLPNTTFDEAGTAVVADILVFRKHDEATLQSYKEGKNLDYPSWVQSGKRTNDDGTEVNFNPYFEDKIAGEFLFGTGEGGRAVYTVKETDSLDKALDKFVKSFAKVKPTRSAKEIEADIDKHAQAMVDSLTLEANGESAGFIGRENGVLVQVIEQEDGNPNANRLVKRPLTPASVWSDSFMQDLDGRWYKLEDKKDKNGKAIKAKDKDGKPLRVNEKVKVYYDEKDISAQSKLGVKGMNVLNQALEIQGLIENQLRLEQGGASDTDIENNRKELNKAYDKFVKTFGYMNNPSNIKYISKLPKANFILALETGYKKEVAIGTGKNKEVIEPESAGKADILSKRVLVPKTQKTHADSPKDALSLSLAYTGGVDLGLMSELTGLHKGEIVAELYSETDEPRIFLDPATAKYVVAEEYLSGNIRQKLATTKEQGFEHNIKYLERVLPQDVPIENISIRLGMNWLPTEIYSEFAQKLLGNENATIDYESLTHNFSVNGTASHTAMNEFGAGGKSPEWILSHILNSKQIRVTQTVDKKTVLLPTETQEANDMAKTIKAEFENFIYSHPEIDKIAKLYNEKHNAIVPRKYDGSHLELIGKVPDDVIKLRTHQMNAVWRGVTTNAVLYDHAVGSGKTFTGIARAMERKRLGLSKKPVLVVPNHMVEQFAQDIYRLYPSANILTAGQKDFAKAKRKRLFGQIATGDYDIIVLPHSSFEFIKLSKERQKAMLNQERDRIVNAIRRAKAEQGGRENIKQLEQAKKNIEGKLFRLSQTKRHDDEFSFEQMGIDDITVDEAHEFKNLFFHTKMQGVKGLGSPAGSNKAMDLWLKTQYLHQTGGAVAFMTGTPISNSAAEMHALMRYLMPDTLAEMELDNFDAWANTYAENVAKFEATESGQLKLATRFAREWQNMGSLMSLWKSVADSVTNDDIKKTYKEETGKEFPLPQVDGGTRQSVVVKPTHQQEQILQMILAGFAKIEAKALDKEEAGKLRLQLMDLATKNSLDPRTINPSLDAGGKISAVVDNVFDVYQKWYDDKGTQIIFLDRSTPKGKGDDKKIMEYEALLQRRENAIAQENDEELLKVNEALDKFDENEMGELMAAKNGGFSAYDEIKKGLIAKGIPADEIAFIQEAETDDEKRELFDKVNAGRVRVIIGSSQRMGAGTNIQKRLVALHHMDAPWKPSDIEQREGRIIRQGNELYAKYGHDNFKVQINAYVTEKTADAKRWDTMSAKLGTINAIRHYNGEHTLDFQEDEENSSFQEIAAQATGNPLMRERVELTAQKEQLERQRLSHQKRDAGNRTKLAEAKRQAQSLPVKIKSLETAKSDYEALLPQAQAEFDKVGINIDGQWFTTRKEAGQYLDDKAKQATDNGKKASYVINGESVGSLSAATQKVRESAIGKKGTTPTLITVGKQTYANANEAINNTVISQVNQHHNDTATAKLMGFDVHSYDMGKNTLLTVETTDGYELTHTTLDHHATREKVENAFARLANNLQKNMGNALSNAQNQLQIANDTISQLEGKTGQAFAGEQELKETSERLNEVQALLSDDDSENAFDDDDKFDDLLELLDSRAIGGKAGKAFVPKAHYDISTSDDSDDVGETDFANIDEVDYDELTASQQKAVDALNALPDSDPNKAKLLQEVYALDRTDSDTAKQERSKITKKATTYELVVRKTGQVANELKALDYTVKTSNITPTDDGYTASITASKDGRELDIRVHRMMNERRANDPTKNGFFVSDGGLSYSFSINEPSIAQGIDTYHEYKTNGNYGTNNRPPLTYTDGTDWQQKMKPEIARLMDDDPRLAGFVEMANNETLAGGYKNEILLALTAYADKQAIRGNALYPHNVGIDGTIDHSQRKLRQLKQDKPYFGDGRPTFTPTADKGKAKDWQQRMAGQLARLFDDDPRLAEFTEKAGTASPLKQAMVLNELKDHASRQAEQGNAMFAFEVIERQNAKYHKGDYKFSKMGGFGERVGLFDLPPIPITTINAKNLGFTDTKKLADEILRQLQGTNDLINDDTGWVLSVGKKDRKKMGDNKNLSHATSQAVQGLNELVKNAIVAETHADTKHNNPDVKAVHRLYAPALIDGQLHRIKLTVKDYQFTTGQESKKVLHAIEAVEIENALLGTLPSYSASTDVQTAQPTTGHGISVANLLGNVKRDGDGLAFGTRIKSSKQGSRFGTTADEVLDTLNKRFGKDTIAKLQANDSLKVLSLSQAREQFGAIPDNADGFYVGGTAYLVHDNIHPEMIIPTFLHEMGGHGGLQTLMSETAYQGFMREFDKLVASGDKLAVKAKALAEKNTSNQEQAQSEYLPYLITLVSRQSQNHSKLKSLINRMMMAIKTFIRQKLGVSLPVTPDEIVAVAEKAVRERASGKFGKTGDTQYSLNESDDSDLARAIDDVVVGKKKTGYVKLGTTPDVLKMLGVTDGTVRISRDVIEKSMANTLGRRTFFKNRHSLTAEAMKELPKQLNNPIAVFNSSTVDGAMVVLTELTEHSKGKDKPVVVALSFETNKKGVELVNIASVYGRSKSQLETAFNNDLLYLHKEKGQQFLTTLQLQLHWDFTSNADLSARNIKTNDDLSQYQQQNKVDKDNTLDNLDIQFSRMADFWENNTDKAKKTVESLGKVASDFIANPKSFVKQGASNAKADHLGKFLQFLGRRQLTDLYGKKLKGLKEYNDRVAQMDADSNETAFRADQLVGKWAKVKDSEQLAELMHDVTLAGIDPTAPIKGAKNAKHAQLKARYDRLSDMAKEVFNQAKDDYQTHYENLHRAMVERIQRNDKLSDERKAKLIAELDKELQASKKAFFPLTRFGDYVVVVRDTDGNVVNVARAETKGQADALRQQLIKDNPSHKVDNVVLGREMDIRNLAGIKGLASEFLADDLGLDDELHQDYLNALLDREFATNNVMVKNTAGFSQNARRAYAHHMSRGSHHIAKLRHTDRLKADLERMQAYIDSQDGDVIELQRVMDEMNKRHALLLNPPSHPVSSLATAVGFMWYMGLSPASALVNLSQTLLVAMPMMTAKYGLMKSKKMLIEISGLLAKNKNDLTNALTGDEKKAFLEAVRRGVIDMTQAHDLAGVANGENSVVMEAIKPVMKVASFMFHQAEKFNRQVTFVASYRLAVEKGLSSEQAMEEAIKITYDGHFDYASSNRPRFMQGNWQRVLFLFKQYGQNMVYTLARQTYLSFKGETPEAKAEARKILAGILAGHAITAGILGLPLVTTLLAFASALGGDDDEPWDAEVALRNQLANLLGDDVAEVIAKGLPRAFGADLSSRVGLDSLILPRLQDGLEGQRLGENLIVGLAGPVMNIPVSMTKGMSQIGQGQTLQGIENMIPKALRDPLKAYRYAIDGNVDKSGIEIVERENVGVSDIAQQAIGFRSGKFAQAQEVKSAIYQADKELTGIRKGLVDSYARAYRDGDMERADEIWERIKRFNEKNPSVKITKPALMKSVRERNRRIENAKDGIYLSKNREHLREYGAFGID